MNGDLISQSALKQYMKDYRWEFVYREDFRKAIEMVDCAPAVDAVEVVRCKDCKWLYNGNDQYCCTKHTGLALIKPSGEDFCSYGERRDDDGRNKADANALRNDAEKSFHDWPVIRGDIDRMINRQPTIDPRSLRPKGMWEPRRDVIGFVRCSVCKDCNIYDDWAGGNKWNYRPNCGAKMEG